MFLKKEEIKLKILLIIIGIVALVCLFGAIRYLLVASRECELPDIDDIEIEDFMLKKYKE